MERPVKTQPRPLRYHLRFQILPGEFVERDARDLVKFCRKHGVEEVVLFFAAEEWNNGLLSQAEEDQWFDAISRAKKVLDRAKISVSLNPWMTTLHTGRGRVFPADRQFLPNVSPLGEVSKAVSSFACPNWREYWDKLVRRFAALGFRVFWVEDDFRYHNHGPLTWGGGFEPIVLKRFEQKIGRAVTREEVVQNILRPGAVHRWRAMWMETWRELQLEVAALTARAAAAASPTPTRLGLMSSHPATHSIEGRDWGKLFEALSIDGRVAHRPHFAPYAETPAARKTTCITLLDVQRTLRPAECEVAPEIENFPFTRWVKSDTSTWAEMALCEFFGSDALLLDLFPFSGNPASAEPQIGELLDRSRAGLEWVAARFVKQSQTLGVGLPWRQDAQQHVQLTRGKGMEEMDATFANAGNLLLSCGIPVSTGRTRDVSAVFGSLAWALDNEQIQALLAGGLLLDSVAAETLERRGYGEMIGASVKGFVGRQDAPFALETVSAAGLGVPKGFYLNANLLNRVARLEPLEGASEWTTIITPEKKRFGAGVVAFRNGLGGRVVTYASPKPPDMLPLSYQRQAIVHHVVDFLAGNHFEAATVAGWPFCLPMHFQHEGRSSVVVFNGSPDAASPQVRLPSGMPAPREATLLRPLSRPKKVPLKVARKGRHTFAAVDCEIPYQGFLVLQ